MNTECVKVIHGANDGEFNLAGATVERIRSALVDAFNVRDDALAFVNGKQVPFSYRLVGLDTLEFCQKSGTKGAGKKKNFTEEDLKKLGFSVVDNEAIPIEDAYPNESWDTARLEAYAKGRIASSLLAAQKAAVDLFWAGCALKIIRDQKKAEGRGFWTNWMRHCGYAPTTVNDATRLYENAKTPDALKGLGVTEAKEKFVYPFKVKDDDGEQEFPPKQAPEKTPKKPKVTKQSKAAKFPTTDSDDDPADGIDAADESPVIEPTRTLTTELEEIAQRLSEIAQDDMGKVDWKEQDHDRFINAVQAVSTAIENIYGRINRDLPSS